MNLMFSWILLLQIFTKPEAAQQIDFASAVKQGLIAAEARYAHNSVHYDKCISITFHNVSKSTLAVSLDNGSLLEPIDASYQNMVITQPQVVALVPGEKKRVDFYAMCTEPSDKGGNEQVTYSLSQKNDVKLKELTDKISEWKAWTSDGQSAIWAYTDKNYGLENIYSSDTIRSKNLREYLSKLTSKPLPDPSLMTSYRYNYYYEPSIIKERIKGSFDFNYNRPVNVSVGMFNERNTLVRELYNEKNIASGFHKLDFEFDSQEYTEDLYNFYLIVDGKINLKIQIKPNEIRKQAKEQDDSQR